MCADGFTIFLSSLKITHYCNSETYSLPVFPFCALDGYFSEHISLDAVKNPQINFLLCGLSGGIFMIRNLDAVVSG